MQNFKETHNQISSITEKIKSISEEKNLMVSTAESCTGGEIAVNLTSLPGSSSFFDSSIIVYSNSSKIRLLSVSDKTIEKYGAVSEQVVLEMCSGLLTRTNCDVAVAVSGIMGPGADGSEKDIGTVWLCIKDSNKHTSKILNLKGNRQENRLSTVHHALRCLSDFLETL